ncbi:MAG TPA: hypothetical protein VLA89_10985, partial [Gemmatimonadales bacterium]|nr:hypothetical protein [Gemmatimonadales bacterium]
MTTQTTARTRTVTWYDPAELASRVAQLGGLEYLRRIGDDESLRAPVALLLGFEDPEVGEGMCVFHLTPD